MSLMAASFYTLCSITASSAPSLHAELPPLLHWSYRMKVCSPGWWLKYVLYRVLYITDSRLATRLIETGILRCSSQVHGSGLTIETCKHILESYNKHITKLKYRIMVWELSWIVVSIRHHLPFVWEPGLLNIYKKKLSAHTIASQPS